MCGIAGIVRPHGAEQLRTEVQRMVAAMPRRGPDGNGCYARDGIALGHARLSIIDVSDAGAQPMVDTGSGLALVFNGEIYNYLELRQELARLGHMFRSQSDTEVLLHAYLEWGTQAFERFVGMWALALHDPKNQRLVLSRDRFGIKPLFLHRSADGGLVFGSTPSVVLAASGVPRCPDADAVERFLLRRSVDETQRSFFDGIEHFPPATTAVVALGATDGAPRLERYWDAARCIDAPAPVRTFADATVLFRERLVESVRLHTRSDVEVSSCLSGGLDSSTLVATLATIPEGGDIRKVFSAIFPGQAYDEDRYSAAVVARYDLQRFCIQPDTSSFLADIGEVVRAQEEPFGSTGIYVQWKVFEAVHAQGIKVAIDGQGADEYLGGYFSFLAPYAIDCLTQGRVGSAWQSWQSYQAGVHSNHHLWQNLPALMARLFGRDAGTGARSPFAEFLSPVLRRRRASTPWLPETPTLGGRGLKRTLVRYLSRYSLPALLRYEDRNSMHFSVESRVPFLDHRLVEFALSLPSDYLINGRSTKRVLRAGVGDIVPELVHARVDKIGFGNPEAQWVSALLRGGALADLLADAGAADLVDVPRLRQLLSAGQTSHLDHNFFWRVFSLLAWRRWAFP